MPKAERVKWREFRSQLAQIIASSKNTPVVVTRWGKREAVLISPEYFDQLENAYALNRDNAGSTT